MDKLWYTSQNVLYAIDSKARNVRPFDRVVIKALKAVYVVWAVEPIDEDTTRLFIRPLKQGE